MIRKNILYEAFDKCIIHARLRLILKRINFEMCEYSSFLQLLMKLPFTSTFILKYKHY